ARAAAVGSLMIRSTSSPAILPASLVACRCASLKYAGTVMTASVTFSPRNLAASATSLRSTSAEISSGAYSLPRPSNPAAPPGPRQDVEGVPLPLAAPLVIPRADDPLGGIDRPLGIQDRLPRGNLPPQPLPRLGVSHHRRRRPRAFGVWYYRGLSRLR